MIKTTKNYLAKILIGLFLFLPVKADFEVNARTAILQDYLSGENNNKKDVRNIKGLKIKTAGEYLAVLLMETSP